MDPIRRRVLVLTVASWLLWSAAMELRTPRHPWADLSNGWFSDHYSHLNAARALPRVGLDLYRRGAAEDFPVATEPLPADLRGAGGHNGGAYAVPGMAADKPWATSWSQMARPYPPGDLLVVAPIALLYEWTDLSFSDANRLLILWFLALAHLAIGLAVVLALEAPPAQRRWAIAAAALLALEAIHWSLQGFYDVAMLTPLLLSVVWLTRGRPLASLVAYGVALFLHFRALFLAPIALAAIWQLWTLRPRQRIDLRSGAALVTASLLAATSLATLWLLRPTIVHTPLTNPAHLWSQGLWTPPVLALVALVGAASAAMIRARAWLDVVMVLWLGVVFVSVRQCMPWHVLVLLPWLFLGRPAGAGARPTWVEPVRALVIVSVSAWLLHNPLWPQRWLGLFWR